MSGNHFTRSLAFNPLIKTDGKDIPFATDIDFITNRFWFTLKKGLTNSNLLPKSMDVVAKAQVALSSHINSSVSEKFDLMRQKFSVGEITKEEAEYLHHELRTKTTTPENITQGTLKDILAFLNIDGFENQLREKSILEKKVAKGDEAIKNLKATQLREKNIFEKKIAEGVEKIRNHEAWIKKIISILIAGLLRVIVVVFCIAFAYLIYSLRQEGDSNLTIFGIIFSFILWIIPLLKFAAIKNSLTTKTLRLVKRYTIKRG